jgi:small subunit ribosomal protein S6e
MPFKINISDKGKAHKLETESEVLVGKKIGETLKGEDVDTSLKGYELEITGTSDNSGHPGFKGLEGSAYHRKVLTYGPGMHDRTKGIRLRKLQRGEEISLKTIQINMKVIKQGETKFESLSASGESKEEKPTETPTDNPKPEQATESETKKEEVDNKEKPTEEKKEAPAEKPPEQPAQ